MAYFQKRLKSIRHAMDGLVILFKTQANACIHLVAAIVVIAYGLYVKLNPNQWALITIAIGTVLLAEAFNTAMEFLTDMVSPGYHEQAKKVKDMAAAAVLLASLMALGIGAFVFLYRP